MRIGSLAQQNVLFWASQLPGAAVAIAVPNGGSARGYQRDLCDVDRPAGPRGQLDMRPPSLHIYASHSYTENARTCRRPGGACTAASPRKCLHTPRSGVAGLFVSVNRARGESGRAD
jgi:hypothetical protein